MQQPGVTAATVAEPASNASFAQLAAEKEQEWRQLQAMHAQSLEASVREKESALREQREKFGALKEDFKYNLKLLAERDQELEQLEVTVEQLRARLQARDAGISELKIREDELETRRAQEERANEDLKRHYQQRVREKQAELEQYKMKKDAELQTERDELEALRRDARRRIQEVEEELEIQRRELETGFDDASRRREKEYRAKIDELSSTVLVHEMKAKLLSKELDLVRGASQQTSADLKESDSKMEDLSKKLRQAEWALSDLTGMKDARIAELENKLQHAQQTVERAEEEFHRKHKELDRYARERESAVAALKESHREEEARLQGEIRSLEGALEQKEVERRRLEWEHADTQKDKELLVEKLRQEVKEVRSQLDGQVARVSKDMVSKDLVIESLRDKEGKLRAELECRKEDIERYKQELVIASEREQSQEQARAQLELDWQRRYEEAETSQYSKSEDLIARLTRARDDAVAFSKELEREMQQKDELNRVLARDRDQAVATLRKHQLHIDRDLIPSRDSGGGDIMGELSQTETLRAENESLIAVIKDMKREMEEMAGRIAGSKGDAPRTSSKREKEEDQAGRKDHAPFTEEYVMALEKECRELKVEKRRLEERLSSLADSISNGGVQIPAHLGGIKIDLGQSDAIKSHIQSLNDTVGALRADKVTTSAELRKHQTRVAHLEAELSRHQHQPREKQVEVDQLRYELTSQSRRHAAESAALARRIGELELQLAEARREAEEYYHGSLQTNLEATTLGQQVSQLTMDLAGRGSTNHQGLQSTLVNQLQREVHKLRAQLARLQQPQSGRDEHTDTNELHAKLKTAARHIGRLARERQQLIEMGNRLRSELALYRPTPTPPQPSSSQHIAPPWGQERGGGRGVTADRLAESMATKLESLEKLQYALTKQELQFARGRIGHDEREADIVQVQLSSPSPSSSADTTPENTHRGEGAAPPHPQPAASYIPHQDTRPVHIIRQSPTSEGEAPSSDSSANQRRTPLIMSSLGEESMQDVWRLLDDGASPIFFRSPSPMRVPDHSPILEEPHATIPSPKGHHASANSSGGLEVAGHSTHYQVRGSRPKDKPQLSAKAAGKVQPKPQESRRKIRNYAVRDNDAVR